MGRRFLLRCNSPLLEVGAPLVVGDFVVHLLLDLRVLLENLRHRRLRVTSGFHVKDGARDGGGDQILEPTLASNGTKKP